MRRALVTGATGFIGANLARRLLADGHDVHLLTRPGSVTAWRIADLRGHVAVHDADLTDRDGVERAVAAARPEWVFHLAVYGAYPWQTDSQRIFSTDVLGTVNLLAACARHGAEAFVNTGSSAEYGFKKDAPAETDAADPTSVYGVAKLAATLHCRVVARQHQARISTLRLYSVYGPFEEPRRFIPALVTAGLRGALPPLVNPDVARDFVYVEDVCDAYVRAAAASEQEAGAVYNVGTGKQTTIGEAVATARDLMQIECDARFGSLPNRPWDTSVWVCDNRLIRARLGWSPRTSFRDGLRRTLQWFADRPDFLRLYAVPRAD
ncbi:MAG TPA: SDR family NAD(P)-dependent oxidoreductase [Candidatus Methylomirabilis sp.]|nr:SDR family NAD(P)-dependent oxidoreductase [Candidatus Methylomirabilis sp.]